MSTKKKDTQNYSDEFIKDDDIDEILLQKGAVEYQRFWLRPLTGKGKIVPLRLRINKRFGGWRLKDELVNALGLVVGDCINTEVTVLFAGNLIDEEDETDLFADGLAADWLLDVLADKDTPIGCVVDCWVELSYCEAPVGVSGKIINKASLILKKGIRFVGIKKEQPINKLSIESVLAEMKKGTEVNT